MEHSICSLEDGLLTDEECGVCVCVYFLFLLHAPTSQMPPIVSKELPNREIQPSLTLYVAVAVAGWVVSLLSGLGLHELLCSEGTARRKLTVEDEGQLPAAISAE